MTTSIQFSYSDELQIVILLKPTGNDLFDIANDNTVLLVGNDLSDIHITIFNVTWQN